MTVQTLLVLFHRCLLVICAFTITLAVLVGRLGIWTYPYAFNTGWLWISLFSYSLVYLAISYFLRRQTSEPNVCIIALTNTLSMIWLYEIFYHFSFWIYWNYSQPPYVFIPENYMQINYALIALTAFSGYRYARISRLTIAFGVTLSFLWLFWVLIGFPQFHTSELYPWGTPQIRLANPLDLAYPLNALTKVFLALTYISLYIPKEREC